MLRQSGATEAAIASGQMKEVRHHHGIETFKTAKLSGSLNRCQDIQADPETRWIQPRCRWFRRVVRGL